LTVKGHVFEGRGGKEKRKGRKRGRKSAPPALADPLLPSIVILLGFGEKKKIRKRETPLCRPPFPRLRRSSSGLLRKEREEEMNEERENISSISS